MKPVSLVTDAPAIGSDAHVEALVAERGTTHGVFTENTVTIQALKETMRAAPNWKKLPAHQKEALEMVAHKIGRILHGDPNFLDHWMDLMGYTQRVVEALK